MSFVKNATKPTPLEDLFLERRGMEPEVQGDTRLSEQ
jgi:hypothetical protein